MSNYNSFSSSVFNNQVTRGLQDIEYKVVKIEVTKEMREYHTYPSLIGLADDVHVKYELKVCECGAEKCGFTSHSDWCPKYVL